MKNIRAFSVFAGVLLAVVSTSGYAKSSKDKNVTAEIKGPQAAEVVATAKGQIAKCEQAYNKFRSVQWAAEKQWDAAYNAAEASARLHGTSVETPKIEKVEPYHKVCAESAKSELLPASKNFINSIKNADAQKSAKDMMAQWITAIDAIGNEGSKAESAKFETLANRLMLDL